MQDEMQAYWKRLDSGFAQVQEVFEACMDEALKVLTADGVTAYLEEARFLGKMGRGVEPILSFLEGWPQIAAHLGEHALPAVSACIRTLHKSPNGKAIAPFLQSLPAVARRLHSLDQIQDYLVLIVDFMHRTTGSIHGIHTTFASPGLPEFFAQAPFLTNQLSAQGLKKWVDYGIRNYHDHPERQRDYFSLQSADARAVLQRERHGTLLVDHERQLDLYLRALWRDSDHFVPYSTGFHELRKPVPYYDALGIRLPDVYNDLAGIAGIDRYRATLAHIAAHRRWSTPIFADNYSPFQRMAVEFFEDSRVEYLAMREYPGLRRIFAALHPVPEENACNPETESAVRHRLAMLSRALLDPNHGYQNPHVREFVERFHTLMRQGEASTQDIADLAIAFVAKTRRQSDQLPNVHFKDTEVDYRDDNRHLWKFYELSDDEEMFEEHRQVDEEQTQGLPPRHYPEWDYASSTYRPDWVSVYESLHPTGKAGDIDRLLGKHDALAKRLKRLLDVLKPQNKVRVRYQEEGSELDLDVALRSLIDFRSGTTPDPRINLSHRHDSRNIAVLLLLDLSESLAQKVPGSEQSILELSQEAVSLLAWAIDRLGDPLAIAGFHSNTRHEVRYLHIKGFSESWDDGVKSRLAAMEAGYSTRMGAALRHAAHYLEAKKADKKLMLILTDGEPADIDAKDERLLIEDAHKAVQELDRQGIYTYCINLDPKADDYVSDIFGQQYTVIDNIQRLPERLPQVFLSLTA
ncbi:nitric oxide reductase activation protein NorD [Methylococcus sp. EFPC2]|uniref:nitric oxide reductase activation protein NorD n=1 Tax=Methylococcus sp. EFPC2 TaxID=2812648 RepID=UPI001968826F|nr:VWA domain-containing protein [Methylococcus sp. EFPC2]QSA96360.1 VWA domain-containing protein [Methylococcus sp. EFPC2]